MELYYVVARDTETGTWFTVAEPYTPEGSVYDDVTEEWSYVGDELRDLDRESFSALSAALDLMNSSMSKYLVSGGESK